MENMPHPVEASITLPSWFDADAADKVVHTATEARMAYVIALARRNVAEQTGGPFAAAVFASDTGRLIAAGVNRVVASSMAIAHAEMVAFAMAGNAVGHHDIATVGRTELVATTEPCAMCLGAVGWSGVTSLVCGARDEDARAVGFDEGPKPDDWVADLIELGISVTRDVMRAEASAILHEYAAAGGIIYNGRAALGERNA
ncbi:MAG: nucleoside deaminase [Acidimicrobiia bacterium]|nr:nucleoside deaminase [Acidimicrobiia bacterium]